MIFACNKKDHFFDRTEVDKSLADLEEPRTCFSEVSLSYHGWPGKEVEDDHPGKHFKTPVMDAFNLRFPTYKSCPTLSCKTSAFQH